MISFDLEGHVGGTPRDVARVKLPALEGHHVGGSGASGKAPAEAHDPLAGSAETLR